MNHCYFAVLLFSILRVAVRAEEETGSCPVGGECLPRHEDILGKTASALRGINGDVPGHDQFFPVSLPDLITVNDFQSEDSDKKQFGPFIQITFHPNFTDLLQEFYGIISFKDSFKAGGIVLQPGFAADSNAQSRIANSLGILPEHVTDPGKSFVLTRYWKKIRTHKAVATSVNNEYASDFKSINRTNPDDIISLFSKYGTHFVSEYEEGDFIYQLFVYNKDTFDDIEESFPNDPNYRFGYLGSYYRKYTEVVHTRPDGEIAGYCSHVGSILAASNDPKLQEIIPLLQDDIYEVTSIFTILLDETLAQMTDNMVSLVASRTVLTPVSGEVFSSEEAFTQSAYDNVLRETLFQKFGRKCSPGFELPVTNPVSFYSQFNPDLVTQTATSYTSIVQANFDLTDLKILNPTYVSDLFIFADVLELPSNAEIHLPGSNNIYMICREFHSYSVGSHVPKIVVGGVDSSPTVKLIANSFHGVMELVYLSPKQTRVTYANGSVFKTVTGEHNISTVTSDPEMELPYPLPSVVPELYSLSGQEHREKWLARSYVTGMELLAIAIETVYSLQVDDSLETGQKSLDWVITTLNLAKCTVELSSDLERVLSRALLIQKNRPNPGQPLVLVPGLTFPQYKELYESLLDTVRLYEDRLSDISEEISRRRMEENIINNQQELNENILEIGDFLVNQVLTEAEYFDDLHNMYNEIAERKKVELENEWNTSVMLFDEVMEYTNEVEEKGDKLVEAVERHQALAVLKVVIGMTTAIASLFVGGAGIRIPEEISGIALVVEKVNYVITLSQGLSTLYDSIHDINAIVNGINNNITDLPDMSIYNDHFPTVYDWDDFDADVEMYTSPSTLRCCKSTAVKFKNAAAKLSSRGRAYLESQKKVSALQYEILVDKMNADIAQRQIDRLNELADTLSQGNIEEFQSNTTDLFELGNILQSKANSIRMQLARTYLTMDAALRYYALKPPTPLTAYDTLAIQSAASQQIAHAINALEQFPSKPHDLKDPIVYEIPSVKIKDLTSRSGFRYTLPLSASAFKDFIRVRIREIRVTIDSIESADADGIYIVSEYAGAKFKDRGMDREKLTFSTTSTEYRYVYNYKTGELIIGNAPSEEIRDKYISLTPFGEWVFKIPEVDSDNLNVNINYTKQKTKIRIEFYLNIILEPATGLGKSSCSDGSLNCLLSKIGQHTITGGFDAVMAMDAGKINALWKQKYESENHGGLAYDITTDWVTVIYHIECRISGLLSSPLVSFIENNPSEIKLMMNLIEAVYEVRDSDTGEIIETKEIEDPISIDSFNEIAKINGEVTSQKMVVVDFSDSIVELVIEVLGEGEVNAIETALESYFKNNLQSRSYDLGTIDFDSSATPNELQPRQFSFTTGGFESSDTGYGTFFICILTKFSSSDPEICEIDVLSKDTDYVIPNGYSAALYVSSKVMFSIIHEDFTTTFGSGTSVKPVTDVHSHPAYHLSGTGSISFDCTYHFRVCNNQKYHTIPISMPDGQFKIEASKGGALQFSWEASWKSRVKYNKEELSGTGASCWTGKQRNTNADFDLKTFESSTVTVDSGGMVQLPKFPLENTDIDSDDAGMGRSAKERAIVGVMESLEKRLGNIKFNIRSVSVFALTNLIFPAAKVITTTKAVLPGDLIVLGDVADDYNPNP